MGAEGQRVKGKLGVLLTFMTDSSTIVSWIVIRDLRDGLFISFHSLALSLSPVVAAMAASIT